MKIPLRWRARWFLRGMASILVGPPSKEHVIADAKKCVDEMLEIARKLPAGHANHLE